MASNPIVTHQHQYREIPKSFGVLISFVFLLLLSFLGFILVAGFQSENRPNYAYAYALQTQIAINAEPSPTPFQPEEVVIVPVDEPVVEEEPPSISEPEQEQELEPEPEPEPEPTQTPTQRSPQKPEGQVNILLLGSDLRPGGYGFRTDSITWVSLNPKEGYISAISFPRDLYVQIPGMGENRINTAFQSGGFETLANTMEINFGVRPDYYVLVHMSGFTTLINQLGGITVQTERNLTDSCASWINSSGRCSVGPGEVYMNADVALWYVRSRYSSTDIDRGRRAQEVILAIFKRLMSLDVILKAPELYQTFTTFIETDINLQTVLSLLPLAKDVYENGDIRRHAIDYQYAYDWTTMAGARVLVPDKQAISQLLIEVLQIR